MKNFLAQLALLIASIELLPGAAAAQQPSVYDEINPDYTLERVQLPGRHAAIVGRHPDGRLLVQASAERNPNGPHDSRRFFWIKPGEKPMEETGDVFGRVDVQYLREAARIDDGSLLYTKEIAGVPSLWRGQLDKSGKLGDKLDVKIVGWQGKIQNPFLFYPTTSKYPVLLFSAAIESQGDQQDIFYSELKDGVWSAPQALAAAGINTPQYNETRPFVDRGGVLFFCSDRPIAPGEASANRQADFWFALPSYRPFWQGATVGPLPVPFNSRFEECGIAPLEPDLRSGYLVSEREAGKRALYYFESTAPNRVPPPRYYALLIATDDYQYMRDLKKPISDCRELAQVLAEDYGFNVDTLLNPTSRQILERLARYQALDENEYLLVAFMGHGLQYMPPNSADTSSVLCGANARCMAWKEGGSTVCSEIEDAVTPQEYLDRINLIAKPRHILTILSACFAGLFRPLPTRGEFDERSRWVLASTGRNLVPDDGPFFPCFVQKLREHDLEKDGVLNGNALWNYCFTKLAGMDKNNPNKPTYYPLPGYEKGGDFPFPKKIKRP